MYIYVYTKKKDLHPNTQTQTRTLTHTQTHTRVSVLLSVTEQTGLRRPRSLFSCLYSLFDDKFPVYGLCRWK